MKRLIVIVFGILSLSLFSQDVVINEFMSSNESTIQDADGDYSDWIEIYNSGDESINLENYMLSDDTEVNDKWLFPSIEIPAKGFLLVFASGKDTVINGELHSNFKIKQSGEYLYLSSPDGSILRLIQPVDLPTDISWGSITDGAEEQLILSSPSPNASNSSVSAIYCSHQSGFYENDFLLSLVSSNNDMSIRYTTNGEDPKLNSSLYTQEILMTNISDTPNNISTIPTTPLEGPWQLDDYVWQEPQNVYKANIIKYAGFVNDTISTNIVSKTFFVDNNIHNRYTFPVISIVTDSLNLFQYDTGIYIPGAKFEEIGWNWVPFGNYHMRGREWEREIHFTFFESNGDLAFETNAGMRMRGYGSTAFPQKSFGVYFRKEYGKKKIEYPIFPDALSDKYKRLVMRSSGNDFLYTHFRDAVLTSILKPMNFEYQRFRPSVLFVNGEYWGVHNIREKYDEYYFEYQHNIEEDSLILLSICGSEDVGSNQEYLSLTEFITENDMTLPVNYNYVTTKIDIENFIDYEIAEIYYANYDWPCNNYRLWKTTAPDSKWRYLIYDLDLSFDFFPQASFDTPSMEHATHEGNDWPYCECSNFFFRELLVNEAFKEEFIDRFAFHLNTTFNTKTIIDSINSYKTLFEPEIQEQIDRWSYPDDMGEWNEEIEKMIVFAQKRPCFMRGNIMDFFNLDDFGFECNDSVDHYPAEGNKLMISPNPSNGQNLRISFVNHQKVSGSYRVISFDGRIVTEGFMDSYQVNLDLSFLSNGVYFFQMSKQNGTYTSKIIISK